MAAVNRTTILDEIIYPAYRDVTSIPPLPPAELREPSPDLRLFGGDQRIDSLKLVSLVVAVERRIEEQLGRRLVLADERAMSQSASPFRTLGALADYIVQLLDEP
jgi:acyl carrier protein